MAEVGTLVVVEDELWVEGQVTECILEQVPGGGGDDGGGGQEVGAGGGGAGVQAGVQAGCTAAGEPGNCSLS